MRNACPKILGYRLPQVRQRVTSAEAHAFGSSGRICQNRHIFPRMIRRLPTRVRVAAMVRRNDQQIAPGKIRQILLQTAIKLLE